MLEPACRVPGTACRRWSLWLVWVWCCGSCGPVWDGTTWPSNRPLLSAPHAQVGPPCPPPVPSQTIRPPPYKDVPHPERTGKNCSEFVSRVELCAGLEDRYISQGWDFWMFMHRYLISYMIIIWIYFCFVFMFPPTSWMIDDKNQLQPGAQKT